MTRPAGCTAVMARRASAPDELDYFPTHPWAVRGFCEWLEALGFHLRGSSCWEPACGEGHMARALKEYFVGVVASDIFPYGYGLVHDFLPQPLFKSELPVVRYDWVITNPPFVKALEFAETALPLARTGVALLLRTGWLEGDERYRRLFSSPRRPSLWLQSVERIPMVKGRLDPNASSATAYGWAVWFTDPLRGVLQGESSRWASGLDWLPPCRARLERREDYL